MKIKIPELALVALVGTSGSGKSSFAKKHFKTTEVLSSDVCRGLVADDENDQSASAPAFELLHFIAAKRLEGGRLTVVDATNVQPQARKPLLKVAKDHDCLAVAIVLDLPEKLCHARNRERSDRTFGPHVIRHQSSQLKRSLRGLKREGFRQVIVLRSQEEVDAVEVERVKLWVDRRDDSGPFDIIGDIHGCHDELEQLLTKLGYGPVEGQDPLAWSHPEGRRAFFVGDLVDRGPDSPGVLLRVMAMVAAGTALCVPGNHENKLQRKLAGRNVKLNHGLAETMEQFEAHPPELQERVSDFIDGLVSHLVLDGGELVVSHAGLKEEYQGRASGRVRSFCLYGETTGETDSFGLPVRYDWAVDYRGRACVVYGHTPVPEAVWLNRTICIDTGCVFGGQLTALRYPERELVDVPAAKVYCEPAKPLEAGARDAGQEERAYSDLLDIDDALGKRIIETRVNRTVTIQEENAAAALEVMSRFAVDPHWLIYLPPTMAPSETCSEGNWLEHPSEALGHYKAHGVERVICQEKHMGSRAVITICRDADVARRRFLAADDRAGVICTRTGRAFFSDAKLEEGMLAKLRAVLDRAGFWEEFSTDWVCLDAELLPWSAKAGDLLRSQYARVGSASKASLGRALEGLRQAEARGAVDAEMRQRYEAKAEQSERYVDAYRRYCWRVEDLEGLEIAPFHILATEGRVHSDRDHVWHMETLRRLCEQGDGFLRQTKTRLVELADDESVDGAIRWWEELTAAGGEGMVVKPVDWLTYGKKGLMQPALKCRGAEYLRIIYGPEYDAPANLARLRKRGLKRKRSLALREYALGLEGLHRFVEGEPLYRVHECVFGVLALESEPVDPRL